MDIHRILIEIEDHLAPRLHLDPADVRLYYHLFRHSRAEGKDDVLISIAQASSDLNCSKNLVKSRLRSLERKGVIEVSGTGWAGTRVRVLLPSQVPGALPDPGTMEGGVVDTETIDFYGDPKHRPAIIQREQGRCFYCRRTLTEEDAGLDHVEPQKSNGGNSYRNVVAACHSCNSSKCDDTGEDFLRKLYRKGFLSSSELEARLAEITKLKQGLLRPVL
jgi:hypothetical protein